MAKRQLNEIRSSDALRKTSDSNQLKKTTQVQSKQTSNAKTTMTREELFVSESQSNASIIVKMGDAKRQSITPNDLADIETKSSAPKSMALSRAINTVKNSPPKRKLVSKIPSSNSDNN